MRYGIPIDPHEQENVPLPPPIDLPDYEPDEERRKTGFLNWRALLQALIGWAVLIVMFALGWWLS